MARVCLVRPLLSPTDFNGYPLNLLILGACLLQYDHQVIICDYDFEKEKDPTWGKGGFAYRATNEILSHNPDFVGITSMCSNYVLALDLAETIKLNAPNVHITFGGPHVSLCAQETLERYPYVDTAVIGEGEITYPELINYLIQKHNLSEVKGIAFRDQNNNIVVPPQRALLSNLNLSPSPAYELIDVETYIKAASGNYLEIYAGSGCPFKCTFCSTSIVWERRYRTMKADRIVAEMEKLNRLYGAKAFNLIHDNLTTTKSFLNEITGIIQKKELDIRWGFSSRVDTIDDETIKSVSAAGCDYIFFGIESGSEKIQRTIKKKLKLGKITEVLSNCLKAGIAPTTSFILGFPNEDHEDIIKTIRLAFLCRVAGARRSFLNLLSSYTGTPVMKEHIDALVYSINSMNTTMVTYLEEHHYPLIEADRFIFANYYSLPYTDSLFTASEYTDIVDFYTICLFRFRFCFAYLINDLQIDPIKIFSSFRKKIGILDPEERLHLGLEFKGEDFDEFASKNHLKQIKSLLAFDEAVWATQHSNNGSLLYSGGIQVASGDFVSQVKINQETKHYLLSYQKGEELIASPIPSELSMLYELQGLTAIRE